MKHLFTILFIGLSLISCSSNEEDTENNNNERVLDKIGIDITNSAINPSVSFSFEYNNEKKLIKKTGGYLELSPTTGYGTRFSNEIYTLLTYTNNKVIVENFSNSVVFTVPRNTIYYSLNSSNQIEQKEVPNVSNTVHSKKQVFKYSQGKLSEIITSFPNMPYDPDDANDYVLTYSEKFYYDANDNLIKTEYLELHNGEDSGRKIVRTFEDYDTSYNPFKRLQLLEEYFYRSISKNNFRKYTETSYYNEDPSIKETVWTFTYDAQGNIVFN